MTLEYVELLRFFRKKNATELINFLVPYKHLETAVKVWHRNFPNSWNIKMREMRAERTLLRGLSPKKTRSQNKADDEEVSSADRQEWFPNKAGVI